ncbi:DUF3267 domain-containing protein [Halorussus halobius]|uniref:DUF3267 domain-containing protein n=1 Tax=Halorussus halobius TaxID=1710537 RepID=UPI001091F598|nr:DUF3267 domain-containing protein [Halorussus halobius]
MTAQTDTEGDDGAETLLAEFDLSRELTLQWTVVSTLGFLVALGLFGGLYGVLSGTEGTFAFRVSDVGWWNLALELLAFAVLVTAIIVPHEWVHGLAIRYYGGRPRYGIGLAHFVLPYAYATTDHRFARNQFVVVALAPLVVLTLVGVALLVAFGWGWLVVPLAANAGGAVGDLWMVLTVLGYPPHVRVEDGTTGVRILGRPDDRRRPHSATALVWDAVVGAAVAVVVALFVLGFVVPNVLLALGVESVTVGRPGTVTYLFSFTNTPTEISFGTGPAGLLVAGLVGLAYAFVRSAARQRRAGSDKSA